MDLTGLEEDELQVLFVNGKITALQYIEALPEINELYVSFLKVSELARNEETALAYLQVDSEMGMCSQHTFSL